MKENKKLGSGNPFTHAHHPNSLTSQSQTTVSKTKSDVVRLGLIQTTCSAKVQDNLTRTLSLCKKAVAQGAQIICLQELFRSLYFCQSEDHSQFDLAEPIPGPSTQAFSKFAKAHKVVVIVPVFEKRARGLYHNSAAVIDADGSIAGVYRKMHIPDDPGFYEKFYFTPGDLGFKAIQTRYAKIGVLICWDQWYPEGARITALAGAEILFYPTAIGWGKQETAHNKKCQHDAWQTIQRSHAIANGVFVCSVNRIGSEGNLDFWGSSFVADPFGEILVHGSHEKEEVLVTPCTLGDIDHTRLLWRFLRDRRIDAYGPITERFGEKT